MPPRDQAAVPSEAHIPPGPSHLNRRAHSGDSTFLSNRPFHSDAGSASSGSPTVQSFEPRTVPLRPGYHSESLAHRGPLRLAAVRAHATVLALSSARALALYTLEPPAATGDDLSQLDAALTRFKEWARGHGAWCHRCAARYFVPGEGREPGRGTGEQRRLGVVRGLFDRPREGLPVEKVGYAGERLELTVRRAEDGRTGMPALVALARRQS